MAGRLLTTVCCGANEQMNEVVESPLSQRVKDGWVIGFKPVDLEALVAHSSPLEP